MARRKNIKQAALDPQVGIFWVYMGNIVQFSDPVSRLTSGNVVPQFMDSRYDHAQVWPQVVSQYPALRGQPYESVPRGRVTMVPSGFNLLVSSKVAGNPILLRQIMRRFGLPPLKTHVQTDTHYENPGNVAHEFEDDESPVDVRQKVADFLGRLKKRA